MKKLLFIIILIVSSFSCKKNEDKAIKYLNEQYPSCAFTIKEAGESVSAYNPSILLIDISFNVSEYVKGNITIDELEKSVEEFEAALEDPGQFALKHPEKCNTKGFQAWVESSSGIRSVFFFFGRGDLKEDVVESTMELQRRYNELLKIAFDL